MFHFNKAASFTATTSHFALNKVLTILAPSFMLNTVTGFMFYYIIKV